ncbi:hypothetical protein [Pleurocapsa sp. PCC 7319]|uniref:hypothetical protein n=1 Tax=Pleurocapsa sp. PCC 7319 TaxID=118161 RepID=UPI00034DEA31|nr:hypothetical protein [Pleurocapsa sp. PCC 7319]
MSKIQIDKLNVTASGFNTLSDRECSEVIGGYYDKYVDIYQQNVNSTIQLAEGGYSYYYSGSNNSNSTSQYNSARVYQ